MGIIPSIFKSSKNQNFNKLIIKFKICMVVIMFGKSSRVIHIFMYLHQYILLYELHLQKGSDCKNSLVTKILTNAKYAIYTYR